VGKTSSGALGRASDGFKWLQMAWHDFKLHGCSGQEMAPGSFKFHPLVSNGPRWLQVAPNGLKWLELSSSGFKKPQIASPG